MLWGTTSPRVQLCKHWEFSDGHSTGADTARWSGNKGRRMEWARENLHKKFENIVWTDESMIQLENHRTFSYRKSKNLQDRRRRQSIPTKLWCGQESQEKVPLTSVSSTNQWTVQSTKWYFSRTSFHFSRSTYQIVAYNRTVLHVMCPKWHTNFWRTIAFSCSRHPWKPWLQPYRESVARVETFHVDNSETPQGRAHSGNGATVTVEKCCKPFTKGYP